MPAGRRDEVGRAAGALLIVVGVTGVAVAWVGSTGYDETVPLDAVGRLAFAAVVSASVATAALSRFRSPRPATVLRRVIVLTAVASPIFVGTWNLVALGFLSPLTVFAVSAALGFHLSLRFELRDRRDESGRVLVATGDPVAAAEAISTLETRPVGFVSPPMTSGASEPEATGGDYAPYERAIADGMGIEIETGAHDVVETIGDTDRLGGFVRLRSIVREHDVTAVALAFDEPDRGEFYGTLELCRDLGIRALVHESHADTVPIDGEPEGEFRRVDLEPWSWYGRASKRAFDVLFAAIGLIVLSPIIVAIAAALALDAPGSVLYEQPRTTTFGRRFRLPKFRTMVPESDDPDPIDGPKDDRITRVGGVLRETHLDEIPQLGSILIGDMSVVGPRPVWVEEERSLRRDVDDWHARWYVKPGLTGLAQINGVTSAQARRKLELDREYIERRTLLLDLKIVGAQFAIVFRDVARATANRLVGWRR